MEGHGANAGMPQTHMDALHNRIVKLESQACAALTTAQDFSGKMLGKGPDSPEETPTIPEGLLPSMDRRLDNISENLTKIQTLISSY